MSTKKPAVHLEDIIDTRPEPPPVWIAFPGSETFQVLIRPLGMRQEEFIDQARQIDWDTATMSRIVKVNQEQYLKVFCAWVIVDWQGLTLDELRKLVLILDFKKSRKTPGPVVCDAGAKLLLMQHSPTFSAWINKVIVDIERFNQERDEEFKKKPLRPSGSSSISRRSTARSAEKTTRKTALCRIATTALLTPLTGRPGRFWPATIWRAPGVILTSSGWRRPWTTLRSLAMSGRNSGALCWQSIGR